MNFFECLDGILKSIFVFWNDFFLKKRNVAKLLKNEMVIVIVVIEQRISFKKFLGATS